MSSCLGRKRTISYGFVLAFLGTILCILNPANISVVMIGQIIRSIGIIPGAYLFQGLFGDALDDVENRCGVRCDGFASSVFNSIVTLAGGVSLFAFNLGLAKLGYIAPVNSQSIIQPDAVNSFIVFCVMGIQLIIYPVLAVISACFPEKTEIPLASAHTSF